MFIILAAAAAAATFIIATAAATTVDYTCPCIHRTFVLKDDSVLVSGSTVGHLFFKPICLWIEPFICEGHEAEMTSALGHGAFALTIGY